MESALIWKAGCGILGDAAKVLADLGVQMASLFDAALVAPQLGAYASPGLKGLCAAFGQALHKSKRVSMSDWAARPLRAMQSEYAAQDAFASLWVVTQLHAAHAGDEALAAWLSRHGRHGAVAAPPPAGARKHEVPRQERRAAKLQQWRAGREHAGAGKRAADADAAPPGPRTVTWRPGGRGGGGGRDARTSS